MLRIAFCLLLTLTPARCNRRQRRRLAAVSRADHTGVADEQKPPLKFGPKENLAWKVAVPPGGVLAHHRRRQDHLDRDLKTRSCSPSAIRVPTEKNCGVRTRRRRRLKPSTRPKGGPAASTPTSDGKRVVVYFGSCGLICYDLDGKEQWRFALPTAVTRISSSAAARRRIVSDGVVYLARDLAKESAVYAIDLANGSEKWKTDRKTITAFSTPIIWNDGEKKYLVVAGSVSLVGYDTQTGKEEWEVDRLPVASCTTPVVHKDMLAVRRLVAGRGRFQTCPPSTKFLKAAGEEKLGYLTEGGIKENATRRTSSKTMTSNKDGKITRDEWDEFLKGMAKGMNRAPSRSRPAAKVRWRGAYTNAKNLPYVPKPRWFTATGCTG